MSKAASQKNALLPRVHCFCIPHTDSGKPREQKNAAVYAALTKLKDAAWCNNITYTQAGAPVLPAGEGFMSISHADALSVVALAKDVPIGVDIETERTELGRMELNAARYAFEADTYESLMRVIHSEGPSGLIEKNPTRTVIGSPRHDATPGAEYFIRQWTRIEALLKLNGSGFSRDFREHVRRLDPITSITWCYIESCCVCIASRSPVQVELKLV